MSLWRMDVDGSDQRPIGDPDRLDGDAPGVPAVTVDWEPRLSPDGTEVVFNRIDGPDYWNTLLIRDLATGEERQVTADDRQPERPECSPDGGWIIYNTLRPARGSDELFEQIERVPAEDPTAEPVVLYPSDGGRLGWKPTYSPDGSSIAFFCEGRLCRMDADGSHVVVLVEVPDVELNHVTWGIVPTSAD